MRTPEGRGGARVPSGGPRVSGVGRFARRSDAQPINVPNVGDSEDLRQGDRAKLEAAMRQRPLGRAPTPRVQAAPRGGNSPAAAGGQAGVPPEHLFSMEPSGQLPLPDQLADPDDDREFVLQMLAGPPFNNQRVKQLLTDLRSERVAPTGVEPVSPAYETGGVAATPTAQAEPTEDLDEPQEIVDFDEGQAPPEEEVEPSPL